MTKALTKKQTRAMAPLKDGVDLALSDDEKAEALAKNFEKVHTLTENFGDPKCNEIIKNMAEIARNQQFENDKVLLTSPGEIKKILRKSKNRKAPGADNITNELLKNLNNEALIQLTYIFNACLPLSYFPEKWKTATILAFHKTGKDPKEPASYKPISLLATLSKILENLILSRIRTECNLEEKLNETQYGFKRKRSTIKQLVRLTFDIKNKQNQNKSTAAIFLDIEKAFDTVWHDILIVKLKNFGVKTYIGKAIDSFLKNRTFRVKIADAFSTTKKIAAGVPQGSILGPVLYIYNNDFFFFF